MRHLLLGLTLVSMFVSSAQSMTVESLKVAKNSTTTKVRMEVEVPRPGTGGQSNLDILFVIDDSGSMERHQQNLLKNADLLINAAVESGLDLHAGVITTNMDSQPWRPTPGFSWRGELAGAVKKVAATSEGDFEQVLRENLKTAMTIDGSGTEAPFSAIQAALSEPLVSTVNKGFLRSDAGLAIFVLTDAEDQSQMPVADFVKFLKDLKVKAPVSFHAAYIPTTLVTGCDRSGEPEPARIESALSAFGTLTESVSLCDPDFGAKLSMLGKGYEATGLRTVQLKVAPVVSSFKIVYGAQEFAAGDLEFGWVYNSKKMQLLFGDKIDWTTEPLGTPLVIEYIAK